MLSTKYQKGLHFIIAGDTNELDLTQILNLSPNLLQIVNKPTRKDPVTGVEALLDPIITSLASYYQTPKCLPPLDCDPDSNGKASDHRIVIAHPISAIDNQCARTTKDIKVRSLTDIGMFKMRSWLVNQNWNEIIQSECASEKASILQSMLSKSFHKFFPEKTLKVNSDDQPWISHKLKAMDRRRKREYYKNRKSDKWHKLDKDFKTNVKTAKKEFYKKMMSDLTSKNTSKWYSSLKRMTAHDQHRNENVIIQDIHHLSPKDQAQKLADHFSNIPNQYNQ